MQFYEPSHLVIKSIVMRYFILTGLTLTFILTAFRPVQEFTVNGIITDDQNGLPVSGVTVREKGGRSSSSSAKDGRFSITVSGSSGTLIFMAAGYDSREIKVKNDGAELRVKLKKAKKALDEVVVVGYGKQREKKEYQYNRPDAAPLSYSNVQRQLLQGELAGVATGVNIVGKRKLPYNRAYRSGSGTSDFNTEAYDEIVENRFLSATENPLSTFSIDVDGASYSNVRRILQTGRLPPEGAVRIEEMINYFHYDYPQPAGDDPFSINTEIGDCAWSPQHKLVMIGLQGRKIPIGNLPASNLVFLIDVSGSMMDPQKLPLVQASMKLLVDQLREEDKVALVVYAGNAGLVLPSTSGSNKQTIKDAIDRLEAGGSTAGGAGIQLAYQVARKNFIAGANNRVILCTDGDFNVGASSDSELEKLIEKESRSGIFLTVLGYGMGNYKDSKMQKLADKGNGNHGYIDNLREAKKVLVNEFGGTLFTIAKDVKLQVEFNPAKVQSYRLIGYENRMLNKEDFNNDRKDAGELGSGHTVTALYEIIPVGVKNDFPEGTDPLKFQQKQRPAAASRGEEIMTIKFRYKKPDENVSKLIVHPVTDRRLSIDRTSPNFRFVSAVAEFGMLLRGSEFKQRASFDNARALAKDALGKDAEGYRTEFLSLLKNAEKLAGRTGQDEEFIGSR
jgi:Ca-activated chloride channel family protein